MVLSISTRDLAQLSQAALTAATNTSAQQSTVKVAVP